MAINVGGDLGDHRPSPFVALPNRDGRIDALRGLAVLGVLLLHTQNAWYLGAGSDLPVESRPRLRDHWLGILSIPTTFGFLGLNLFFVLSGLCIHLWTLKRRQRGEQFRFPSYMKHRLIRLYPAYFGAIVFSLVCLGVAEWLRWGVFGYDSWSPQATHVVEQTLRYLTFTHTLKPETFAGYNAPLYTMAIEFQFYFLYPLVLWGIFRWGVRTVLAASVVMSTAWTISAMAFGDPGYTRLVMDSFLVRWPEWIVGCLLAEMLVAGKMERFPLIHSTIGWLITLGIFAVAAVIQIWFEWQLNVLWTAALIPLMAVYLVPSGRSETTPERWLRHLGLISYSVYLLHFPVLRIAALLMPPEPTRLLWHLVIYVAVIVAIVWGGRVFFRWFELPFLTSARRTIVRS